MCSLRFRRSRARFLLFIGCYAVLRFNDIPVPEVLKCCLQFLIFKKKGCDCGYITDRNCSF